MAGRQRQPVLSKDITGLKFFDVLSPLLERLHEEGCARDKAGNRQLHFDQYCALVLRFLFNPIVSSLRSSQQASQLPKVQKALGCPRASLGSLSEATDVFDAERLLPIIAQLAQELAPVHSDPRLADLKHTLTLVDGTLLRALPNLAQAALLKEQTGQATAPGAAAHAVRGRAACAAADRPDRRLGGRPKRRAAGAGKPSGAGPLLMPWTGATPAFAPSTPFTPSAAATSAGFATTATRTA